jgi:Co/Zn/Cd efflux system component
VLGLLIVLEGIRRIVDPPDVGGTAVLVVALVGIVVNLAATWTLSRANRQSPNVEGAFQHTVTTSPRSCSPPSPARSSCSRGSPRLTASPR